VTLEHPILLIPIARTPKLMQEWTKSRRMEGKTIGCVPTMGALHEGHLSLIKRSAMENAETIVTIFVNPLQFGPKEDFAKYPRMESEDIELAKEAGATIAYCPTVEAMYSKDQSVYVVEEKLSTVLCGKSRPGHFRGVTTVVAKLLNACLPDKAYFGLKDYQQLLVIKKMIRDLDFPVQVISCVTVREPDGLAMSSRNKYLSADERRDALALKRGMDIATEVFKSGELDARAIEQIAREEVERVANSRIDYIECRDAETLDEIDTIERPAVLAMAVFFGATRLIDNTILTPSEAG
jgi:pantoate--beta-alanine ligase